MASGIPIRYRPLIAPVGGIVLVVMLGFLGGRYTISRLFKLRSDIDKSTKSVEVLEGRLAVLRGLSQRVETYQTDVLAAIPATNPSLLASAQMKQIAAENNLVVTELKSNVPGGAISRDGMFELSIRFALSGEYNDVKNFVEQISNSTPVVRIKGLEIASIRDSVTAEVDLSAFWAPFPEKLPPIDQPIEQLSASELTLLARLAAFASPAIRDLPNAIGPQDRPDPFNL
jgi:hypothetical protein